MSGNIRILLLLSALAFTACSEDATEPTKAVKEPTQARALTVDLQRPSPIVDMLPAMRTGAATLQRSEQWQAGRLAALRQRDANTNVTAELRVVRTAGTDQLVWFINGRRFVSLDYGDLAEAPSSLTAARGTGNMYFHDTNGEVAATFDPVSRKLHRNRHEVAGTVAPNPFGDDGECESAIFSFYNSVVFVALAFHANNAPAAYAAMAGMWSFWRAVEFDCSWVFRVIAWSFAQTTLGQWWNR